MAQDNRGFSLIELIIVVMIMGVLGVGATYGYTTLHNANVNSSGSKLLTALGETRTKAVSKKDCKLTIRCDSEGACYYQIGDNQEDLLASNKVTVSWKGKDSVTGVDKFGDMSSGYSLVFSYERASGSFKPTIVWNGTVKECELDCSEISIVHGSKSVKIQLMKETGKSKMTN